MRALAATVVVVWSDTASRSANVLEEAADADAAGVLVLVPVTLRGMGVVPPRFQHVLTLDLAGWSGDPGDPRLRELVDELRIRVGHRSAATPEGSGTGPQAPNAQAPDPEEPVELLAETEDLLAWAIAVQRSRGAAAIEDVDVVLGA